MLPRRIDDPRRHSCHGTSIGSRRVALRRELTEDRCAGGGEHKRERDHARLEHERHLQTAGESHQGEQRKRDADNARESTFCVGSRFPRAPLPHEPVPDPP
jgi:hypothetical protein